MLKQQKSAQAGFTLVELAIVMIIIGLLIGGVLKGQALIANAQVTSTVAQMKGVEAAVTTFKDTYNGLPGDITTPTTRLPNCTAGACSNAGDGNGRVNLTAANFAVSSENAAFFPQLNAAGLISGISPAAGADVVIGNNYPAGKISATVVIPANSTGVLANHPAIVGAALPAAGLYLYLNNAVAVAAAGSTSLKPDQALRIDTKMDDAAPDTGLVRGFGTTGAAATDCGTSPGGGVAGVYATLSTSATCGLYIKTQN